LQRLDDQNPVLAEQAARLVAVYRRLWESYVAKHADSSRLESVSDVPVLWFSAVSMRTSKYHRLRVHEKNVFHSHHQLYRLRRTLMGFVACKARTCEFPLVVSFAVLGMVARYGVL
jgi:hypothetical protein